MDINQSIQSNKPYVYEDVIKEIEASGISSICRTINKFNKIMDETNVTSKNKDLEELIKEDLNLTIEVLKTANSPLFRTPNKQGIDDILNAINMVGWDAIYKIGMSLTVKGLVKEAKVKVFANWMITRSITIANICDIFLGALKSSNNKLSEINTIYAHGLLHDIGSIGLLQVIDQYQQDVIGIKLIDDKKNWSDAENILYGFDHNMIGEQILLRTQLPRSFSIVARHHHVPDPLKYSVAEAKKIALIRLAQAALVDSNKFTEHEAFDNFNSIADGIELIRKYDDFSEKLKNEFEEYLGLTPDLYDAVKSAKLTDNYIKNISQQFQY
jgi:HD-like signal output (HDOD) protein